MLPRIHRFSPRTEAPVFFQVARVVSNRLFAVHFYTSESDSWQATVIVSKKVSLLAVQRNAIKRMVRAQLQEYFSQKNPKLALAVVVKPAILNRDSTSVKQELYSLLSQIIQS